MGLRLLRVQTGLLGVEMTDLSQDPYKLAEIASRTPEFLYGQRSKPFGWEARYFVEWATIVHMMRTVGVPKGGSIIDVGCGAGWTSLFLAESGYQVTGYDLVPANIDFACQRAERWGSSARFEVADFEMPFDGPLVDAALVFDALHHSSRQSWVLSAIARRVRPGGWLLIGEPTWLHSFSPDARKISGELGWQERGLRLRQLKRDLRMAGFDSFRRFHQPTQPYEGFGGFFWQLTRLVAGHVLVAPQTHYWLAARRKP